MAAILAGTPVVLGVDRLGVNDRAFLPQLSDQGVVSGRKIDVVARITGGRGAHVLGIVWILERKRDAVHGHGVEVGIIAELRVQLRRALQRVGLLAKLLA